MNIAITTKSLLSLAFVFLSACLSTGFAQDKKPTSYKDSTVVQFFQRTSGWSAGDGAFSIPLSDGRTLWTMGDSFVDTYDSTTGKVPCLFNTNNALLLQPAHSWDRTKTQTLLPKKSSSKTFFRDSTDDGDWYWPVSGIQLKDTIYIYYSGIARAMGGLGFAPTDKDMLAKVTYPGMELVGYHAFPDLNKINFGVGFIPDEKTGYVYAYGHRFFPERNENDMYVARFRSGNPTENWEFWDGKKWNSDVTAAESIRKNAGFTPMVCKVKDKYVIVGSELSVGCDQGKDIYASVSDKITGPFSDHRTLFTIDDTLQGHYPFFYVPVMHPQFINDKDEILLTYNVNGYGACIPACVDNRMDPNHYRPRGVRVPLTMIDPDLTADKLPTTNPSLDSISGYKHPIRGVVYLDGNNNGKQDEGEKGMAAVAVSDGRDVVLTDDSGRYLLPNSDKKAFFALIHQPETVKQSGQHFFHRLLEAGSDERFNFGLHPLLPASGSVGASGKSATGNDATTRNETPATSAGNNVSAGSAVQKPGEKSASTEGTQFVQLTDSHIRNISDGDYMKQATSEIYNMTRQPDFIVATGDLVDWGVDEHFINYVAGMQKPPVPYYNVFGNHEVVFGPIERYYSYLGPDYYSFEQKGILYLALNCVSPSERQNEWMEQTLALLTKGRPVVIFQHFPPSVEEIARFARMGVKSVFTGHWHSEKEMEYAGVQSINTPPFIMGGIDASPAGFKVVHLKEDGSAETEWRYGFQDKTLTIVSPQEGVPVSGHFPIIVNAYSTSHKVDAVTWKIQSRKEPADSGHLRQESALSWTNSPNAPVHHSHSSADGHTHDNAAHTHDNGAQHSHSNTAGHTHDNAAQHSHSNTADHTHDHAHPAHAHTHDQPSGSHMNAPLPEDNYSLHVEVRDDRGTTWSATRNFDVKKKNPAAVPAPKSEWPMFMGNAAHTGVSASKIKKLPLHLAWSVDTQGDPDFSSPIYADGRIYLSHKKRTIGRVNGVSAYDPATGKRLWMFKTEMAVNHTPAYYQGVLCVAEMGGRVYGISAATGKKIWQHDLIDNRGRYNYGAPAIHDGHFYVGVMRRMAKIRPQDGHVEWEEQVGKSNNDWISSYGSPALSENYMAMAGMFFGGEAMTVANNEDGKRIWGHNADNGLLSSPTIAGSRIVYTSMKSIVYAKNLADGKDLWQQEIGVVNKEPKWSATTPAVKQMKKGKGIVVAGSGDGHMVGLDLKDGRVLWTHISDSTVFKVSPYRRDNRPLLSSPAIAGDKVFFGSADGHLYCLDLETGKELWAFKIGVPVMSTPLVTGNVVYVAAYDGRLYAFTRGRASFF